MDSDFGVYAKLPVTKRGTFARQTQFRERDCIGGTYHTLLFSESRIVGLPIARGVAGLPSNPSLALAASEKPEVVLWPEGRGAKMDRREHSINRISNDLTTQFTLGNIAKG